jgi:hypothetical protein
MVKHLIFASVLLMLCAQSSVGIASPPAPNKCYSLIALSPRSCQITFPQNKKLLLIIIDFDDFMCLTCLESFLSFCRSVPPHILEENAWGILVLNPDNSKNQDKTRLKIAQKKLRGFMDTHRIPFPILIDSQNVFPSLAKEGSGLLFLDDQIRSVFRCIFPLSKEESERILSLLLQ